MADDAIFEETQRLHQNAIVRYVMPLTLGFTLVVAGSVMLSQGAPMRDIVVALGLLVGLPLAIALMPMRTVVTPDEVCVRSLVFYRKRVAMADVVSADAIAYNPIGECGGWGIRPTRKHGLVLNIAGDKGVMVRYARGDGEKRLLIGSRRSDELEDAIRVAASLSEPAAEHGDAPSFSG
jgi:hypothetical protein